MPPSANSVTTVSSFLRAIPIIQYLPAFILLLSHGIAANSPYPALGLLPLAISVLQSLHIFYPDYINAAGSSVRALTPVHMLWIDVFLACFQLALLIPTWIALNDNWYHNTPKIILGSYCTVFMMVDFGIHIYFALRQLWHIFISIHTCQCPHCLSVRNSFSRGALGPEYTPLQSVGYVDDQSEDVLPTQEIPGASKANQEV